MDGGSLNGEEKLMLSELRTIWEVLKHTCTKAETWTLYTTHEADKQLFHNHR